MAKNPHHQETSSFEPRSEGRSAFETVDGPEVDIPYFVGRLGGQGANAIARGASNESLLRSTPDAAPLMSLSDLLSIEPLFTITLWRSALMEGMGTMMLVWVSSYAGIGPPVIPEKPSPRWGVFNSASFVGPLCGSILNFGLLTLFTFTFGAVSGAHLNPTITIATLFARLCSLPRAVLYLAFQTAGAALAGLLLRASYGSRDFRVGGCWFYPDIIPLREAFTTEFMACLTLLFLAFGIGLDPRQKQILGPTLSPFMVGLTLGTLSFATGYSRYGHGGVALNPARCFGTYVGSGFPHYHWIHWIADIAAGITHAVFYHVVPPWQTKVDR